MYGLAAQAVRDLGRRADLSLSLRPEARFHDGTRLTAHDVAFSLDHLKEKGHPIITAADARFRRGARPRTTRHVVRALRAEARARRAAVRRQRCRSSRTPITARSRSTRSTLDPPLGSGPYKVGSFEAGPLHRIRARRRTGGAPICRSRAGRYNFDVVRYEYYRDRDVGFEGFTGKSYLFREEFTSRIWATRYDFPAISDGRVKREMSARRHALGRAGLVHQHAAREIQESARARGA